MKRLHVRVSVKDIAQSVRFWGKLFVAEPAVVKPGYAKSEKALNTNPLGMSWEDLLTFGKSSICGDSADVGAIRTASGGLVPSTALAGACRATKQQVVK